MGLRVTVLAHQLHRGADAWWARAPPWGRTGIRSHPWSSPAGFSSCHARLWSMLSPCFGVFMLCGRAACSIHAFGFYTVRGCSCDRPFGIMRSGQGIHHQTHRKDGEGTSAHSQLEDRIRSGLHALGPGFHHPLTCLRMRRFHIQLSFSMFVARRHVRP